MAGQGEALLRRLCSALRREQQGAGEEVEVEQLGDALNAALVLLRVRPGARLDGAWGERSPGRGSPLLRAVAAEARRLGVRVAVVGGRELLVLDLGAVRACDAEVLRGRYGAPGADDMQQPLLGALGRALGYGCAHPGAGAAAVARASTLSLLACLHDAATGERHDVWLAGFLCAGGGASARQAAASRVVTEWVGPAARALGGATLRWGARRLVVAGFRLHGAGGGRGAADRRVRRR